MKKWLPSIIAIIVILVGFYFLVRKDITNYPPKNDTIVLFGDSLAFGYGSTKDNDMASQLSRKLNTRVINMGVNGNTSSDGVVRVDEVVAQNPGIVLLSLGGNDFLRRVDRSATRANLATIIQKLQGAGSVVIILGVRDQALVDNADEMYKELSKTYKTGYVSNILAGLVGDSRYMFDSIHPNDVGYAKIVERVYPVVVDLRK